MISSNGNWSKDTGNFDECEGFVWKGYREEIVMDKGIKETRNGAEAGEHRHPRIMTVESKKLVPYKEWEEKSPVQISRPKGPRGE